MDGAATGGHLDVVKFLHARGGVGCTEQAMDGAATNGHLDVVLFLHEHRTEGCTAAAMDGAAGNGHLDIVRFLHAHRTEGCSSLAFKNAAANGHLDAVKFIHAHYRDRVRSEALDEAALNGHLHVLEWFHANGGVFCEPHIVDREFLGRDREEVFKFLLLHNHDLYLDRILGRLAQYNRKHLVEFVLQRFPPEAFNWTDVFNWAGDLDYFNAGEDGHKIVSDFAKDMIARGYTTREQVRASWAMSSFE